MYHINLRNRTPIYGRKPMDCLLNSHFYDQCYGSELMKRGFSKCLASLMPLCHSLFYKYSGFHLVLGPKSHSLTCWNSVGFTFQSDLISFSSYCITWTNRVHQSSTSERAPLHMCIFPFVLFPCLVELIVFNPLFLDSTLIISLGHPQPINYQILSS